METKITCPLGQPWSWPAWRNDMSSSTRLSPILHAPSSWAKLMDWWGYVLPPHSRQKVCNPGCSGMSVLVPAFAFSLGNLRWVVWLAGGENQIWSSKLVLTIWKSCWIWTGTKYGSYLSHIVVAEGILILTTAASHIWRLPRSISTCLAFHRLNNKFIINVAIIIIPIMQPGSALVL